MQLVCVYTHLSGIYLKGVSKTEIAGHMSQPGHSTLPNLPSRTPLYCFLRSPSAHLKPCDSSDSHGEPYRKSSHNASRKRAASNRNACTGRQGADTHLGLGLLLAQGRLFELLAEVVHKGIMGRQVRSPFPMASAAGQRG